MVDGRGEGGRRGRGLLYNDVQHVECTVIRRLCGMLPLQLRLILTLL